MLSQELGIWNTITWVTVHVVFFQTPRLLCSTKYVSNFKFLMHSLKINLLNIIFMMMAIRLHQRSCSLRWDNDILLVACWAVMTLHTQTVTTKIVTAITSPRTCQPSCSGALFPLLDCVLKWSGTKSTLLKPCELWRCSCSRRKNPHMVRLQRENKRESTTIVNFMGW